MREIPPVSPPQQTTPVRSIYRRLLLPIYAPTLLSAMSLQALLLLVPLYVLDIGGAAAFAAFLIGLRGVGMLLFDLPVGVLLARFGDKPVLVGALLAMTLSALLFAWSGNAWMLGLAAILSGSGFTAWMIGRQFYIAETSRLGERGRAIAAMAGTMRLGDFAGPAMGAAVAHTLGFQTAFLMLALLMACAALMVAAFAHKTRQTGRAGAPHLEQMAAIVRGHARVLTTGGLASIGLQLMRSARVLLIPLFGHFLGLEITAIGFIISLTAVVDSALFYPSGWVMDRYGRKSTGVPSLVLFAIALALLPLAQGYHSLFGIALLSGVANGLSAGLLLTLGSDLAPAEARGEFLGIWRLIGDFGHAGGPLLIGMLIEVATLAMAATAVAGLGLLSAAVLYWLVEETLKPEPVG
jgi:MFS family permease